MLKVHFHFNDPPEQVCALNESLEVGQTATIHLHQAPEDCDICPNGHCHASNITLTRIDEETLFVALEPCETAFVCEISDSPPHRSQAH